MVMAAIGCLTLASAASAAPRAFEQRFTTNDTGDVTGTGNTLLTCPDADPQCVAARAGTASGAALNNNNYVMQYMNTDAAQAPVPVFNSSTATLLLPAGATVLKAMLYFGADSTAGAAGAPPPSAAARNTVLFKAPGGSYGSYTASPFDFITTDGSDFQGAVDVTSEVAGAGAGPYSVANVQAGTGRDRQAGWALAIAYRDTAQPPRNLTLFDGFQVVNSGNANVSIPVSGFRTPPTGAVRTRLGLIGYEGDAGSRGDTVKLNTTTVSDVVNPPDNVFNSSIAAEGINYPLKNPNYVNQLGFDGNFLRADGILPNGATSAVIRLTTGGETYFPGGVAFSTELFAPQLDVVKSVVDLNGGQAEPGDVLRYTLTATNTGGDAALNVSLEDPIPANTTYVPDTLTVDGTPLNDAFPGADRGGFDAATGRVVFWVGTNAVAQNGGTLEPGASATATFDVAVAEPPAQIPPGTLITNAAAASFIAATLGSPLTADSNVVTTTVAAPDLTIAKTPPSFTAVGGSPQTWNLTVTNTGTASSDGSQVTVTDAPPDAAFDQVTAAGGTGWSCAPATPATTPVTITCTRTAPSPLAPGASYPPITITAVSTGIPPFGTIANTTFLDGGGDGDTTNNSSTSTGSATTRADLQVLKTADVATVRSGDPVTYTIRVRNGGPSTATAVAVTDPDLAGPDFDVVSATPSQGSCTLAVTCDLGNLASGAEATVTIVANVLATTPGTLSNTASAASTTVDPDPSNDQSSADVVLPASADLSLAKSAAPSPLQSGAGASFTLTVSNAGPQAAASTVTSDRLPDAFTPSAPLPAGCTYAVAPPGDGVLSCNLGVVAAGATEDITVNGTLAASAAGTLLSNSALVSSATADPDPLNNTSTISAPVAPAADLELTKFADNASPAAGGTVTFSLALINRGPTQADDVRVTDTLPAGLTFVSASPGCAAAGQAVTCAQASLAAGADVLFQVTAQVGESTAGQGLTNLATAAASNSTPDPIAANNTDVTTITPVPAAIPPVGPPIPPPLGASADLVVGKRALGSALVGRPLRYAITVQNRGPSTASAVTVSDTLSSRVDFISATASRGRCSGTRAVTCAIGDLGPGATATVTLTVRPRATGAIANGARATSATPDPNAADNVAATTVRARYQRTRISLGKRADRATVSTGGVIAYRITVRNRGAADARNLRACDRLDPGLALVSRPGAKLRNGQACWTIRRLARGRSRTLRLTARALNASSGRFAANRVRVTGTNVDARTATARVRVRAGRNRPGGVTG